MKIFKISQNTNYEMITQNPDALNNPDVQLSNMQQAQEALKYFANLVSASQEISTSLRNMENILGMGDIGLVSQFENNIKQASMQTQAFNLLAQMNFVSSVDNLLDQGQLASIDNVINDNIGAIQSAKGYYSNMQS